jgi:hypothetical protein
VGGRRQGPRGVAMARATRGAGRGGRDGGAAQGGSHSARTGGPRPASACGPNGAMTWPTSERRRGRRSGAPRANTNSACLL